MLDIPYCGVPPVPGGTAWNSDPVLIAALLGFGAALARRTHATTGTDRPATAPVLALGWAVLVLALVSPLCNLSVALFSARVAQHLVLTLVAAPLLAYGMGRPRDGGPPGSCAPTLAFALALWAWHLPAPYAATFRSDALYWAMHASLFGSALWLWRVLAVRAADRPDTAALAGLATAVQMGVLGALLTFAPRPLFPVHAATTAPWGLTALEDQQLGGLLMWVPGGLVFAAVVLLGLGVALRGPDRAGAGLLAASPSTPAPR